MTALSHMMMDGGMKSSSDYVQDGLLAMWDGLENAGRGVHDAGSSVWVDLCGNEASFPVVSSGLAFGDFGVEVPYSYGGGCVIQVSEGLYNTFLHSGEAGNSATFEWCWSFVKKTPTSSGSEDKVFFGISSVGTEIPWCTFQWRSNSSSSGFSGGPASAWNGSWIDFPDIGSYHTVSTSKKGDFLDRYIAIDGVDHGAVHLDSVSTARNTSRNAYILPNISSGWSSKFEGVIHCIRCYSHALDEMELRRNWRVDRARYGSSWA